jgi:hypothetical protein
MQLHLLPRPEGSDKMRGIRSVRLAEAVEALARPLRSLGGQAPVRWSRGWQETAVFFETQ